jgi:diacylglycerol kinase (ATP)
MRLTLVHNPKAGMGQPTADELRSALQDAGYIVEYCSVTSPELSRALDEATDVVMVAGGDGTVASVARRLAGRDVPLVVFPLGTANNLALALGVGNIAIGDFNSHLPADRVQQLPRKQLTIGSVRASWGAHRFVEAAGTGIIGSLLRAAANAVDDAPDQTGASIRERLAAGRQLLHDVIANAPPQHCDIIADGLDLSGAYLMATVVSSRLIGPRIALLPASAAEHELHLVVMREEDRAGILHRLSGHSPDEILEIGLPSRPVKQVHMDWLFDSGHVDDKPWPDAVTSSRTPNGPRDPAAQQARVEIEAVDAPLQVLCPHY